MLGVHSARAAKPRGRFSCQMCGAWLCFPPCVTQSSGLSPELHLRCAARGRQTSRMPQHPGKLSIMENVSAIKKIIYIHNVRKPVAD